MFQTSIKKDIVRYQTMSLVRSRICGESKENTASRDNRQNLIPQN